VTRYSCGPDRGPRTLAAAILDPNSQRRNPSVRNFVTKNGLGSLFHSFGDDPGMAALSQAAVPARATTVQPKKAAAPMKKSGGAIKDLSGMAFWHVDDFNGQQASLREVFDQAQKNGQLPAAKSGRR